MAWAVHVMSIILSIANGSSLDGLWKSIVHVNHRPRPGSSLVAWGPCHVNHRPRPGCLLLVVWGPSSMSIIDPGQDPPSWPGVQNVYGVNHPDPEAMSSFLVKPGSPKTVDGIQSRIHSAPVDDLPRGLPGIPCHVRLSSPRPLNPNIVAWGP